MAYDHTRHTKSDLPDRDRRRLLQGAAIAVAAMAVPAIPAAWASRGGLEVDRARFPQSVASGDPRPDRVLLWTRLAGGPTPLRLQVSTDEGFGRVDVDRLLQAPADSDGCVRVRVTGLAPGTTYFYRFVADDGNARSSPTGRTRTAPAPDAAAPLRFAFLRCQDYGGRW
ncbi:MAG TPA: PhoD-like phosphatase N-terminal domain-containing protein, partial [Pseudoxanthomonas sp.]|nr:PhoD-like phosphatase N-terminal domain-containing protein [Pseudoxanthomonas sp.]